MKARERLTNLMVSVSIGMFMLCNATVHAQLITEGANPFIFQQMDNLSGAQGNWTRSVGVGYFNQFVPGLLTQPQSFLHVYSGGIPPSSPIPNAETFRTTVGSGNSQFWRMERNEVEIGRLYHFSSTDHFRILAVQSTADLMLENAGLDGIRIAATGLPATLNGFNLSRQGFVTVGSAASWNQARAWSRLHLAHENLGIPPVFAYRPWMRNGVTGTGNSTLYYMGHLYQGEAGSETDGESILGFAWGKSGLPAGPHDQDHASFRFLDEFDPIGGGSANTVDGLELMRLQPYREGTEDPIEGFVGIGDFLAQAARPEERLDVLNGRVRIRQLPSDDAMDTEDRYVVADNDGVLGWRYAPPGSPDCDWNQFGANHVRTAWPGAVAGCPTRIAV